MENEQDMSLYVLSMVSRNTQDVFKEISCNKSNLLIN